ncbi:hypothetical protein GQ53DRAFT_744127 [Thozetella sp. PMI_491]|nr:hypothetical protein GQ53DRAFT_744127 [Thozetella sp. PMI_491]
MALSAEVLIAGSGPVGLWLALELRRAKLDVLVIDTKLSRTDRDPFSKALGVSAGSLETLDSRGLASMFLAEGARLPKNHFGAMRTFLDLDEKALGTRYPFNLAVPQARTEALLLTECEHAGVRFEWGLKFVSVSQTANSATATAVRLREKGVETEETVNIECAWLVGCDGTHSAVRKAAGIAFEGVPSTVTCITGDVKLTELPKSAGASPYVVSRGAWGCGMLVTMGDGVHHRFAAMVREVSNKALSETLELEEFKSHLRDAFGSDLGAHSPHWLSRFGSACRLASSFREGRVLLAGDAAHQFLPAGGQGLNLGWQDTTNLAWKLAFALREQNRNPDLAERIIDSYSRERHPLAQDVIDNVLAQLALFIAHEPHEAALRSVMEESLKNRDLNVLWARRLTGFGEQEAPYLQDGQDHDLLAGKRFTHLRLGEDGSDLYQAISLDRFVLLLPQGASKEHQAKVQAEAAKWGDRVTILSVAGQSIDERWDGVFAALIRPDVRIAWAGREGTPDDTVTTSLAAELERWFGVPA